MTLKTGSFGDRLTPIQLLIDAMEKATDADIAVFVMRKGDTIHTGWTGGELVEKIGLCEMAKIAIYNSDCED